MIKIFHQDALLCANSIPDKSIQLIYIDPPFFCGVDKKFGLVFKSIEEYLSYVLQRIAVFHSKLKDDGSFFIHCDTNANYRLRALLEPLFGPGNFVNEIAWCYGAGNGGKKRFNQKHDTIFFYQKSSTRKWNDIRDIKTGSLIKSYWSIKSLADKSGYLRVDDEVVLYPTQKPIELLERIIACSTDPGDIVLDFFAGSGTTGVAAKNLSRHCILIDSRIEAINVMQKRGL